MDAIRDSQPEWKLEIIDWFKSPREILETFASFRPDIVVINPLGLVFPTLLATGLTLSGCTTTKRVVASRQIDNVLKIKVVYNRIFDVLNIDAPVSEIITQLSLALDGVSTLDNDKLWKDIEKPEKWSNLDTVAKDDSDVAILSLISVGLTDAHIAKAIHLSAQSVRNRVSGMLTRSDCQNRTQLTARFQSEVLRREISAYLASL